MEEKKVINYYRSFYEVSKDLDEKQFYQFNMAIYKVMFFEENIEKISFEDKILSLLWKSISISLKSSLDGYCSKKKIDYNTLFMDNNSPLSNPLVKGVEKNNLPLNNKEKGKGKGKGKEKEKGKEKVATKVASSNELLNITKSMQDAMKLEDFLYSKIKSVSPKFKKPNSCKWHLDIDKAIRLDGRTRQEIFNCINWIYTTDEGKFWIPNIMSGKKLREKFDIMNMQVIAKNKTSNEMENIIDDFLGEDHER